MHAVVAVVIRTVMFVAYDTEFNVFFLTIAAETLITSITTFGPMVSTALFPATSTLIDITAPLTLLYIAH